MLLNVIWKESAKHYSELGIKGFKVDFMDRDDQAMVDFSLSWG